jgi:iron complex transport system substrate-binding protein
MIARRALLPAALLTFGTARAAAGPARIVSVGGAITEAAFALGAGPQVAAVDTTSRFPPPVQGLPQIGYMCALAPEGLIALRPDLLLLSDEAGPVQALAVLRAAGLPIALIHDGAGLGTAEAKIRAVAAALGVPGEPVAADWQALDAPIGALARRPRTLFVLSAARGAPLVSGRGTHADAMLRASGAENVVGGFTGYRPLSAEAAATLAPEAIVMMDHTIAEAGGVEALLVIPALAVTPAAARRVVSVEGSYALGFGPRAA